MKHIQFFFLSLSLVLCLIACNKENNIESTELVPNPIENTITILPLGDSRVEGNRPEYESYRYELWKNLVSQNYSIDFVGTHLDESNYPNFMGQSFDRDHQGTGGAQTSDILELN